MENEKKIKTRFLSVPTLLKFLLLVSVCLFCVALYVNSHPELLKKTTPTPEPTATASTVEPTASALPAHLTDPNSVTVLVDIFIIKDDIVVFDQSDRTVFESV